MKRKLIAILLSATMSFSMAVNTFAYTFKDTQKFSKEIEEVTDLGFIFSKDIPYFEPDTIVTRHKAIETMYILANANLIPADGDRYYEENVYPDLYQVYDKYILKFSDENKILDGIVLKTFKENSPVTYGEMITMLVRTLNLHEDININVPQDTEDSYIEMALQLGLLDGLEFEKDGFINNESLAKLIYNSLRQPLPNNNVSLMESSFKDLYAQLESIQNNMAYLNRVMSNPKSAEEISENDLISRLKNIVIPYYEVRYLNENLVAKQDLKLDDTYMSGYVIHFLELCEDINEMIDYSKGLASVPLQSYIELVECEIKYVFLEEYEEVEYGKDISTNLHKRLAVIMYEKLSRAKQILLNNPITPDSVESQMKEFEKAIDKCISVIRNLDESIKDLNYYDEHMNFILTKYISMEYIARGNYTSDIMRQDVNELYSLADEIYYVMYEMKLLTDDEDYGVDIELDDYEYLKDFKAYKDTALSLYTAIESLINKLER